MGTELPPALDTGLVQQIVLKAHGDFDSVRTLIEQERALVNGVWDWGNGDFETPLLAAAHTGQRDIALYLLEHGAQLSIPAAVMLGEVEIVRAALAAFPALRQTPGAHGISLVAHAGFSGSTAMLALLVDNPTAEGISAALFFATALSDAAVVAWLLDNTQPDLTWQSFQGKTALQLATERGDVQIAELLRARGA